MELLRPSSLAPSSLLLYFPGQDKLEGTSAFLPDREELSWSSAWKGSCLEVLCQKQQQALRQTIRKSEYYSLQEAAILFGVSNRLSDKHQEFYRRSSERDSPCGPWQSPTYPRGQKGYEYNYKIPETALAIYSCFPDREALCMQKVKAGADSLTAWILCFSTHTLTHEQRVKILLAQKCKHNLWLIIVWLLNWSRGNIGS